MPDPDGCISVDLTKQELMVPRAALARAVRAMTQIEALALIRSAWRVELAEARIIESLLRNNLF